MLRELIQKESNLSFNKLQNQMQQEIAYSLLTVIMFQNYKKNLKAEHQTKQFLVSYQDVLWAVEIIILIKHFFRWILLSLLWVKKLSTNNILKRFSTKKNFSLDFVLFVKQKQLIVLKTLSTGYTIFVYQDLSEIEIVGQTIFFRRSKGEGSSARNSSARKNYSTPKSRLLDTARKRNVVHVRHTFVCRAVDTFCVEQMTF